MTKQETVQMINDALVHPVKEYSFKLQCFVYIMELQDDSIYVGITTRIFDRIYRHFNGYSNLKYQGRALPKALLLVTLCSTKEKARSLEIKLHEHFGIDLGDAIKGMKAICGGR